VLVPLHQAGPKLEKLVLIGDHKQLPPTVISRNPALARSLFQRLAEAPRGGAEPVMLLEQRRMHSLIAEFPNASFYGSRLANGVDDAKLGSVIAGAAAAGTTGDRSVAFVDVPAPAVEWYIKLFLGVHFADNLA
jgi:superfamily I DNA and/or RNA helicase